MNVFNGFGPELGRLFRQIFTGAATISAADAITRGGRNLGRKIVEWNDARKAAKIEQPEQTETLIESSDEPRQVGEE